MFEKAQFWMMAYPGKTALIGGVLGALAGEVFIPHHSWNDPLLATYQDIAFGAFPGILLAGALALGLRIYEEESLNSALRKVGINPRD